MLNLPMLGTEHQTESSKFQVTLVVKIDKNKQPFEYPRINRFFDNLNDRNTFIKLFESSINEAGGSLKPDIRLSHSLFESFNVVDERGKCNYALTVYK